MCDSKRIPSIRSNSFAKLGKKPEIGKNNLLRLTIHVSYLYIYLFCSIFDFSRGCMPGFEQERARLRQYLGLDWIPSQIDAMDSKPLQIVRSPSELNCNFNVPSSCLWRNAKDGLDSNNFHLFRKEDNSEFPVMQVRPGPSKIPVGDQLLLTGDRKREEQTAMLVSHPIKCQNSTDKQLTFDFWVYNGARVEVLVLEEREGQGLVPNPEKPQIDCGTVMVNTECTVPIPPFHSTSFIAIRAYDMRNTEGSFAMIDNIFYSAQFCKVSIDFGPMARAPLFTNGNGDFVKRVTALNCKDFDGSCRWRNVGQAQTAVWQRATGTAPSPSMLFNETGTHVQPDLPSAFLYIEEGANTHTSPPHQNLQIGEKGGEFRMLVSDPIQCLAQSTISMRFRVWATKGIKLGLCVLDAQSMRILGECQPISASLSPAVNRHEFQSGVLSIMFAFRVESVNVDFDNFFFLDDIEFEGAKGCGELANRDANEAILDDFAFVPMLSTLLEKPIHSAKELNCDFAKRALNCRWTNLERLAENMVSWEIGIGKKAHKPLATYSDPNTAIAIARLERNSSALLISESILCVLGNEQSAGTLSLRTWSDGGDVRLSVCIVRSHTMEILACVETEEAADEDQVVVDIPPVDEPIQLVLRGSAARGGQIVIDDIQFDARICSTSAVAARGVKSTGGIRDPGEAENFENPGHPTPDENVCRLLSCAFDGNMCLYTSPRVSSSVSLFRSPNQSAFTMLFERSRFSMLESPPFHLNAPARLHFDFLIKKGSANLHICHDSVSRELDSCFLVFSGETSGWSHDFIELLPTDRKFYVIGKLASGSRKTTIQLDNFMMTDIGNHGVC